MAGFKLCEKHYYCVPGRKNKQANETAGHDAISEEKAQQDSAEPQRVQWFEEDVAARAVRRALKKKSEGMSEFAMSKSENEESTFEIPAPEQPGSGSGRADSRAEDRSAFRQCAERQVRGGKLEWQCRAEALNGMLRCRFHTQKMKERQMKKLHVQRALKAAGQAGVSAGDRPDSVRCAERIVRKDRVPLHCPERAVEGKSRCKKHTALRKKAALRYLEKTRALLALKAAGGLVKEREKQKAKGVRCSWNGKEPDKRLEPNPVSDKADPPLCAEYCKKDGKVAWRCKLRAAGGKSLCEKHLEIRRKSKEKARALRAPKAAGAVGEEREQQQGQREERRDRRAFTDRHSSLDEGKSLMTDRASPLAGNVPDAVRCSQRTFKNGKVKWQCPEQCVEERSRCEKHCEMQRKSALKAARKQLDMGTAKRVETRSALGASEEEGRQRCVQRQMVSGKELWRCKEDAAPGKERCENHIHIMKRKAQRKREQRRLISRVHEEDESAGKAQEGQDTRRSALAGDQLDARSSKRLKVPREAQDANEAEEPQQCGHALRAHGSLLGHCKKNAAPGESKCAHHLEMLKALETRKKDRRKLPAEEVFEKCREQLGARREAELLESSEGRQKEDGLGLEEDERCTQYRTRSWRCTPRRREGSSRCEKHVAMHKKYQTKWWQKTRVSKPTDGCGDPKAHAGEGTAKGTEGPAKALEKNPKRLRTQGEAILALAAPPASSGANWEPSLDAPQPATCQPEASPDSAKSRGPTVAWPAGSPERKQSEKPCPNFPDVCPKLHKPDSATCTLCASVQSTFQEETPAGERRLPVGASSEHCGQLASADHDLAELDGVLEHGASSSGALSNPDLGGGSWERNAESLAFGNAGPSDLDGHFSVGRSDSEPTDRAVEDIVTCVSGERDGQERLESDQGSLGVREPLKTVDEADQTPLPIVRSDQGVQKSSEAEEAVQRPLAELEKRVWVHPETVRSGKGVQERPETIRSVQNALEPRGTVRSSGAAPDRTARQGAVEPTAANEQIRTTAGAPAVGEKALQRMAAKICAGGGECWPGCASCSEILAGAWQAGASQNVLRGEGQGQAANLTDARSFQRELILLAGFACRFVGHEVRKHGSLRDALVGRNRAELIPL